MCNNIPSWICRSIFLTVNGPVWLYPPIKVSTLSSSSSFSTFYSNWQFCVNCSNWRMGEWWLMTRVNKYLAALDKLKLWIEHDDNNVSTDILHTVIHFIHSLSLTNVYIYIWELTFTWEMYMIPNFTFVAANKMLLWSDWKIKSSWNVFDFCVIFKYF